MKTVLLPILYLPPISWFRFFLDEIDVLLEQYEHLPKQTLRNRAQIFGANGKLNLTIPLKKNGKRAVKDIEISYNEDWQKLHWKSIKNVYQSAPYFEYYEDTLRSIYECKETNLMDFNLNAIHVILRILKTEKNFSFTEKYQKEITEGEDKREAFEAKRDSNFSLSPYYQVFSDKLGFINDLSIVDLLCNLGPEAVSYIQQQKI